jgi:Protein of unknown function (DUF1524)
MTESDRSKLETARAMRAAVGVLLVGLLFSCGSPAKSAPAPTVSVTAATPSPVPTPTPRPSVGPIPLADVLARLEVAPEHLEGYDRDLFPHWTDDDADGCNTRYEVLITEAVVAPEVVAGCDLVGGSWRSPYDDVLIEGSAGVQIDHLVALAEAWYSGAWAWTTERRERFANDLGVSWALVAVSPEVNEAKAASDPAEWLPPDRAALCEYVAAWIGMKVRWSLTIDIDEKRALDDLVVQCPEQSVAVPLLQ